MTKLTGYKVFAKGPVAIAAVGLNPAVFLPSSVPPPPPPPPAPAPPLEPIPPPQAPPAQPPPATDAGAVSEATMAAAMELSGMTMN